MKTISAPELKKWIDEGRQFELFDVRTDEERRIAKLDRASPLDREGEARLVTLDREMPVVFMCHHGIRSRNAAGRALRAGFTQVYNLEGGIDAWSQKVDPTVPRY